MECRMQFERVDDLSRLTRPHEFRDSNYQDLIKSRVNHVEAASSFAIRLRNGDTKVKAGIDVVELDGLALE